jgi:hypothetical protein
MGTNGFREEELVSRKVKVGNEWQTRIFPIIGGRLRLAHEGNETLSLQTEMVNWDGQYAIFRCSAITNKGQFVGYGTANSQRDARLAESLVELAETRSIARALRFAGFGLEFTGAEEVSHVPSAEPERQQSTGKEAAPVFPHGNGDGKNGANTTAQSCATERSESKPSSGGNMRATQSQCRALYALTKRANYTAQDIESMLRPLNASSFQDLSRESASKLITSLQSQVAA